MGRGDGDDPAGDAARDGDQVKGKGMPELNGRGRGDHYIEVQVDVPRKVNSAQRRLLLELQRTLPPPEGS